MADAIVRENALHYGGRNYFKAGATEASIGAVGEKRTPLTKANYLEVKARIGADKLRIREFGEVPIDAERTNKRDFLANVSLAKVFKIGSVNTAFEDVTQNKLKLMYMSVDANDMVRAINRSPRIREDLQRWGDDARVVTSGFVIVKAETARQYSSDTEVEADISVHGVAIKPKLTSSTRDNTRMEFPVGSFYAYGLSRLIWDSPKNPKELVDLKFDAHGL